MFTSLSPRLPCIVLLGLTPVIALSAEPPVVGNVATATENHDPHAGVAPAAGGYASEVPKDAIIDNKDGTALAYDNNEDSIPVAQELDFIRESGFRQRGAYDESLKTVTQLEYYGTRYVDCEQYGLEIHTARPNVVATVVKSEGSAKFQSHKSNKGIVIRGEPQGLPVEDERALLETFDFDSPILNLQKKHPTIKPLGMQKLPGMLTWKVQTERAGGHYRVLYIDSHTGDVVKFTVMNTAGAPVLDVTQHDYRSVEGIRVPFAVDYRSPNGTLLASDRLERVEVIRKRS